MFSVSYGSNPLPEGIFVAHQGNPSYSEEELFVSRRKSVRTWNAFGVVVLALLITARSSGAAGPVTGAIFTTTQYGEFVNANLYDSQEEVYLNGGPRPNAPCTAAGLPDGDYYFQVTDPSGSVLLSSGEVADRKVTVSKGIITAKTGTHATGIGGCGDTTVQLSPYQQTPNEGGEYKVWMTPVGSYSTDITKGSFGFLPKFSKTDNFKVNIPEPAGCPDLSCDPS
jgi:hypothetical protein